MLKTIRNLAFGFSVAMTASLSAQAADPAIDMTRLLDTVGYDGMKFYGNGPRMMLDDVGVIFRPDGAHNAVAELQNAATGEVISSLGFFEGYQWSNSVFGDIRPQNGGMIEPPGAGDYRLVFKINGAEASALPFSIVAEGGDDPFNPDKTFYYRGPWEKLAYLRTSTDYVGGALEAAMWFGGADMPSTDGAGKLEATLTKGGAVVAQTSHAKIVNKRSKIFAQFRVPLFKPADGANPPAFTLDELRASDGRYRLTATIDGAPVRSFPIIVANGEIVVSPRSAMGHQPHTDYLAPRFVNLDDRGLQNYSPEPIYWLESGE